MNKTDRELIAACGDKSTDSAFAELVRRYRWMVHGTCRRVTGSEHDAEDLTQVVFALLSDRAPDLVNYTSLAGWLGKTAWHVSAKFRRDKQRRRRHEDTLAANRPDFHIPDIDGFEVPAELAQALAELDERHRDMIVLYHFVGLTLQQIAEISDEPVGTVASRLCRARIMLRGRLASRGITPETIVILFNQMEFHSPPEADALSGEFSYSPAAKPAVIATGPLATPLGVIARFQGKLPVPLFETQTALGTFAPASLGGVGTTLAGLCGLRAAGAIVALLVASTSIAAVGTAIHTASKESRLQATHNQAADSDSQPTSKTNEAKKEKKQAPTPNFGSWSSNQGNSVPEPTTATVAGGTIAFLALRRR